jgi:preprotein translocase subunit SecG
VVAAFWCWVAAAVVGLIGLVLVLTSPIWDLAVAAGARQSGNLTTVNVQNLVSTLKVVTVVIAVIFVAVYLFFAWKMYAGRNWSRIVLTVFGALTLLSAFTPTSRTVTVNGDIYNVTTGAWAGWVQGLLALAGIVLMYLPLSNAYFKQSKAFRQANR